MATIIDFSFIKSIFKYSSIFGQDWVIPVIITVAITIMLSRQTKDMGVLFLPTLLGLKLSGMYFSQSMYYTLITMATFSFLVNTLSTEVISGSLKAGITAITKRVQGIERFEALDQRASRRKRIGEIRKQSEEEKLASLIGRKPKANIHKGGFLSINEAGSMPLDTQAYTSSVRSIGRKEDMIGVKKRVSTMTPEKAVEGWSQRQRVPTIYTPSMLAKLGKKKIKQEEPKRRDLLKELDIFTERIFSDEKLGKKKRSKLSKDASLSYWEYRRMGYPHIQALTLSRKKNIRA